MCGYRISGAGRYAVTTTGALLGGKGGQWRAAKTCNETDCFFLAYVGAGLAMDRPLRQAAVADGYASNRVRLAGQKPAPGC
jgi:hypothetical protein